MDDPRPRPTQDIDEVLPLFGRLPALLHRRRVQTDDRNRGVPARASSADARPAARRPRRRPARPSASRTCYWTFSSTTAEEHVLDERPLRVRATRRGGGVGRALIEAAPRRGGASAACSTMSWMTALDNRARPAAVRAHSARERSVLVRVRARRPEPSRRRARASSDSSPGERLRRRRGDLDLDELARLGEAGEVHDLVVARAAAQLRRVGARGALDEHLHACGRRSAARARAPGAGRPRRAAPSARPRPRAATSPSVIAAASVPRRGE